MDELWSVEHQLRVEGYFQVAELRNVDPGHKVFQIVVDPVELKPGEDGKESACLQRRMSAFPVRVISRGIR